MKKQVLKGLTVAAILVLPLIAGAQANTVPTGLTSLDQIYDVIVTVADYIFAFLLILAVIFILFAAFQYLTSAGDEGKVSSAKSALIYALVAVAVALLAKGLLSVVGNLLGVGSVSV